MKRLILLALLLPASTAHGASIDVVRSQFLAYSTASGADRTTARMQEALSGLEGTAYWLIAPERLRADGRWTDINYDGEPAGTWGPWDHTRRLIAMARAYQTPGQSLYRDPSLRASIDAALRYTLTFYGSTIIPNGNWWFWTIGIPMDLGPTLVLMRGEVDQSTYDDLVFAIRLRIGDDPAAKGLVGPTPVGQNLVWSCYTHMALALARNDEAMLGRVRDAMATVTLPSSAEGIKTDRSFHQHGAQLYTGGYGGAFAADVARHALITRGTDYALPPASLASFADYVADGIAWSLYGDYFDVSVVGREVARPTTTGYNGLAALLQASELPSARQGEIRAAAAKMLETWKGTMPTELAGLAAALQTARVGASWPSGHRHYHASDYTIHRRPGWFASVKMFSTRTKSGEKTNNENLLGSRQSDGRFYLVQQGNEYMGRDIWPALDWTRLPGITVEQRAGAADATYGYGTRTLAGGTGDGRNGVSAMELAPLGSELRAKKAWFFFDDSIAFLTSDVKSLSLNRVETVVNQWPLMNPASQFVRRDDWAVLEGVGYWFPSSYGLKTTRETRSGTWASLGGSADTTTHSKTFVTILFDHGVAPVGDSAEYVIVPNATTTSMSSWAASRPLHIVINNRYASAVRDQRTGALGIAFWAPTYLVEGYRASAQAVVYATPEGSSLRIHAADPNGTATGTFELTVPGAWSTSDVPAVRGYRSTKLTIPRAGGKTTSILLRPIVKRRAVR